METTSSYSTLLYSVKCFSPIFGQSWISSKWTEVQDNENKMSQASNFLDTLNTVVSSLGVKNVFISASDIILPRFWALWYKYTVCSLNNHWYEKCYCTIGFDIHIHDSCHVTSIYRDTDCIKPYFVNTAKTLGQSISLSWLVTFYDMLGAEKDFFTCPGNICLLWYDVEPILSIVRLLSQAQNTPKHFED